MTERIVYVVNGSKGDYSDRTDWIVGVFETREEADAWERAATKWIKDAKDWIDDQAMEDHDIGPMDFLWESPYDPSDEDEKDDLYHRHIDMGYGEPSYWVTEEVMGRDLPNDSFEPPKRRPNL